MEEFIKLAMEESVELRKLKEETKDLEIVGNEYLVKDATELFADAIAKIEKKYGREETLRLGFNVLKDLVGKRGFEELKRDFQQGMKKEALERKVMMKFIERDCGLNCRQW